MLILPLICFSFSVSAVQEIAEPEDGKAVVSKIKDLEIEEMLASTAEFKTCRDQNKFVASDSPTAKDDKIAAAEKCFQDELKKKKGSAEKLKELSEKLNLQTFGLVRSKNVNDIQKYLNDKMYKAMTGVDREKMSNEQLVEQLKFKNKKHIDQGIFIKLYKTQLTKNALFEISKFCFEKFRNGKNINATNFAEHWKDFNGDFQGVPVNDLGQPEYGSNLDVKDKDAIYKNIFDSIKVGSANGSGIKVEQLSNFFTACGKQINTLCNVFKTNNAVTNVNNGVTKTSSDVEIGTSNGAAACLARNKILEYKQALANVDKVSDYFKTELAANPNGAAETLLNGQPIKNFGQDRNDESIDNLTNYTSDDLLNGGGNGNDQFEDKAKKCTDDANLNNCEDFITQGETLDKVKHGIEQELTLKKAVEMERVRALVSEGEKKLEDYLNENGYFDLLKKYKEGKLKDGDLVEAIGHEYEAKKVAMLAEINNKLGKRQVSDDDAKDPSKIAAAAGNVIKESKEERARLAQVVLFNNIITSHLQLKVKATGEERQNVNAWKKEEDALNNSGISEELFANLKAKGDGPSGAQGEETFEGMAFIDKILGDEGDDQSSNQNGGGLN